MDILKRMLLLISILMLLLSCHPSKQYNKNLDNLIFIVYDIEILDLGANVYYLNYGSLKDTFQHVLSESERTAIITSFDHNKMSNIKGFQSFFTELATMPVLNLQVFYHQNDKLYSSLVINDEFSGNQSEKDKMVKMFHDDFFAIFNNNVHVKATKKKIEKYNAENFPDIPLRL